MKKQKGFSLIELLIVVAIILIIAAIAIPNLMRSKMAANEASAVASLRTINTAEVTYDNTYQTFTNLISLGPGAATCPGTGPTSTAACLVDNLLANASAVATPKSGYYFTLAPAGAGYVVGYTSLGQPSGAGTTGTRSFCSDQNLVLFFNATGGACNSSNSPL